MSTTRTANLQQLPISGVAPGWTYVAPSFAQVSSLLHFNGANNSTVITDQTANNAWAVNGGAVISTAQSVYGGSSLYSPANGTAACIKTTNSAVWDVGSGDWTCQFRWKYNGGPETFPRLFQSRNGDVYAGMGIYTDSSSNLSVSLSSTGSGFDILSGGVIGGMSQSVWNDVIIEVYSNTLYGFINGFLRYTQTLAASPLYYAAGQEIVIGGQSVGSSRAMNAYLDEFRFIKGLAVLQPARIYPAPAAEYPNS